MPVAKSFQEMEQVTEPYAAGGKMYVKVKHPNTGNIRQVRWYTDAEYSKYYPEVKIIQPKKSQKRLQSKRQKSLKQLHLLPLNRKKLPSKK